MRKELLAVLGICALVLVGLTAIVALFGLTGSGPKTIAAPPTNNATANFTKVAAPTPVFPDAFNGGSTGELGPGQRKNALATFPEAAVIRQFGAPISETAGAVGISDPSGYFAKQYPQAKTLIFQSEGGLIYAVFDKVNKTWVCIASEFIPDVPDPVPTE